MPIKKTAYGAPSPYGPYDQRLFGQQALQAAMSPDALDKVVGDPTDYGNGGGTTGTTQPPTPAPPPLTLRPQEPGITSAPRPLNQDWQAPAAASGANTSINAPRLARNPQNQWQLNEHGNTRTLQDSEAGNAQSYVDDFWNQFPTGFQPGVGPQQNSEYGRNDARSTAIPTSRGSVGQLTGYPGGALDNDSMKHAFGNIASRFGNDRHNLQALMQDPEFQRLFPNATLVGDDKIDFGGQLSDFTSGVPVGLVDVSRGGDDAWQWIDQNFVNDAGGGGGGGSSSASGIMQALQGGGVGGLDQILEELNAIISGRPSPTSQGLLQSRLGQ